MISYLIISLCVFSILSWRIPPLSYALFTILHDQLSIGMSGWDYYLSAGAFDVLSLSIIAIFSKPSRLAMSFVYICIASLFLNFYGWLIWLFYLPPDSYDISFLALYSIAIYIILRGDDVKDERYNNFNIVYPFWDKGSFIAKALFKEARN